MRKQETITLPGRRCGKTAAVLEIQRRAIAAGFRIVAVSPACVVGTRGKYGAAFPVEAFLEQQAEERSEDDLARLAIESGSIV